MILEEQHHLLTLNSCQLHHLQTEDTKSREKQDIQLLCLIAAYIKLILMYDLNFPSKKINLTLTIKFLFTLISKIKVTVLLIDNHQHLIKNITVK